MLTWVKKNIGSNLVLAGGYTDQQKAGAYLPPGAEWVSLSPQINAMPVCAVSPEMVPPQRWVWADGVVTAEDI